MKGGLVQLGVVILISLGSGGGISKVFNQGHARRSPQAFDKGVGRKNVPPDREGSQDSSACPKGINFCRKAKIWWCPEGRRDIFYTGNSS